MLYEDIIRDYSVLDQKSIMLRDRLEKFVRNSLMAMFQTRTDGQILFFERSKKWMDWPVISETVTMPLRWLLPIDRVNGDARVQDRFFMRDETALSSPTPLVEISHDEMVAFARRGGEIMLVGPDGFGDIRELGGKLKHLRRFMKILDSGQAMRLVENQTQLAVAGAGDVIYVAQHVTCGHFLNNIHRAIQMNRDETTYPGVESAARLIESLAQAECSDGLTLVGYSLGEQVLTAAVRKVVAQGHAVEARLWGIGGIDKPYHENDANKIPQRLRIRGADMIVALKAPYVNHREAADSESDRLVNVTTSAVLENGRKNDMRHHFGEYLAAILRDEKVAEILREFLRTGKLPPVKLARGEALKQIPNPMPEHRQG